MDEKQNLLLKESSSSTSIFSVTEKYTKTKIKLFKFHLKSIYISLEEKKKILFTSWPDVYYKKSKRNSETL